VGHLTRFSPTPLPLLDLTRQIHSLKRPLQAAFNRVLHSGQFILGEEVSAFEREFARFCRSRYAIGVASGSDALELTLRALAIGPGDLVATVSFTFMATVDAISHVGASPLFVDIDPTTFTMDPEDLERKLSKLHRSQRRKVKAILPVHLFGNPCDMDRLLKISKRLGLFLIEDTAQALGAHWKGAPVGSLGEAGCFSFFPSKNLGGFGDGGMVLTPSSKIAQKIRSLRIHGRDPRKGLAIALGRNSRLDALQAALLRVKLRYVSGWILRRRELARVYTQTLKKIPGIRVPSVTPGATHAYSLYVIRARSRDLLKRELAKVGIDTQVYYCLPVQGQGIYRKLYRRIRLPQTEKACQEVLALPLFPEMTLEEVARVCRSIRTIVS